MQITRGFTLIELLVTITIISILASIIYVSFGDARTSSRNKAMTVELKEVQLALETFRSQNGKYPLPEPGCGSAAGPLVARTDGGNSWCANFYFNSSEFREAPTLIPEYITTVPFPVDSANSNCVIEYQTDTEGTWYKLTAINCLAGVDADSGIGPEDPLARCAISCDQATTPCDPSDPDYYQSFAVYSAGGRCE